ncbi:Zn-dependent protease [Actinoplanes sp. NBRC 101535]|nr:Zn-dependent protease [Actinoplanes sp. NBRC 101535]
MRAGLSVVMLVGFYVLGLVQFAAALLGVLWIWGHFSGLAAAKFSWILLGAVGAIAAGLWRALRARPDEPHGLILTPEQAPELWATVREMADEAGTRAPDEIRLVPEVNAAVSEDTRLLGLIAGTRRLYIGMPLLQTFTVDQMRSVLAHELGHYSGSHTRMAEIAYRGRLAMHETLSRVGKWNVFGWVFKGYGYLYLLVSNAVGRRQELEADLASVRVAGVDAAVSTMRDLPVVASAWNFYFGNYVAYGWEIGYAPDDIFGGFGRLYAARTEELAELRDEEPDSETSRWDSHPAPGERIAAMRAAPASEHPTDGRPASVLLPQLGGAALELQSEVIDFGTRTVLSWPDFTAASLIAIGQRRADRVFRAAARRLGVPEAGLAEVLGLVEAGRLGELAAEFAPNVSREEAATRFAAVLDDLFELAAVRSGAAVWKHSWSEPARLVDAAGEPVDYSPIAKLAVAPETLGEARAKLAEAGIEVAAARVVETKATASGADVIGALPNVRAGDDETDLILLTRGMVLVPAPKDTNEGEKRVAALVAAGPERLAAHYRFVAYEDVAAAQIVKTVPMNVVLSLHDGTSLTLKERWTSDTIGDSRDIFEKVLNRINERANA